MAQGGLGAFRKPHIHLPAPHRRARGHRLHRASAGRQLRLHPFCSSWAARAPAHAGRGSFCEPGRGSSPHCCHSRTRRPVGALTAPPAAASRTHRSLPDLTNPCRGRALLLANLPRPQQASVFSPQHLLSFFKVPKPLGTGRQGPGSTIPPSLPVLPASSAAFNHRAVFPACVLPPVPPALARTPREAADFKAFQAEPQHFPGSCSRARHRLCPSAPPYPTPITRLCPFA